MKTDARRARAAAGHGPAAPPDTRPLHPGTGWEGVRRKVGREGTYLEAFLHPNEGRICILAFPLHAILIMANNLHKQSLNCNFTYFLVRRKLGLVLPGEFSVSFKTQAQHGHRAPSPRSSAAAAHENGPELAPSSASPAVAGNRCRDNEGEIDGSD